MFASKGQYRKYTKIKQIQCRKQVQKTNAGNNLKKLLNLNSNNQIKSKQNEILGINLC